MRFAGNFHPEWGYLAPAPSFMRTARIVVVATAIGATAGAGVVLSLAARPSPSPVVETGKTLVVVHSLVQPAEAAVPPAMTVPASAVAATPAPVQANAQPAPPANTQASIAPPPATSAPAIAAAASDSRAMTTSPAPTSVEALAESPPLTDTATAQPINAVSVATDPAAAQKYDAKKPAVAVHDVPHGQQPYTVAAKKKPTNNGNDGLGSLLRRLFSARTGTSSYQN